MGCCMVLGLGMFMLVCGLVVVYGLWVGDELGFWGLVWGFCGLFGCDVRLGVLGVGLVTCVV